MNSANSFPRASLSCRAVRAWSALSASAATSSHVKSCPACAEYFRAAGAFDAQLRHEARHTAPSIPPGLELRVMQAIEASHVRREPRREYTPTWRPAGLLAAALACVAIVFFIGRTLRNDRGAEPNAEDLVVMFDTAEAISGKLWNEVLPSATTAVSENPLQQELNSVVTGARSALDFLALNFLPTSATESVKPRANGTI
jgi:predicted anti-sigma-YlaC factor YlaD